MGQKPGFWQEPGFSTQRGALPHTPGQRLFLHPAIRDAEKILQELLEFYDRQDAEPQRVTRVVSQAIGRLRGPSLQAERNALGQEYRECQRARRRTRGVCPLGQILPEVLLRVHERLGEIEHETETKLIDSPNQANPQDATRGR